MAACAWKEMVALVVADQPVMTPIAEDLDSRFDVVVVGAGLAGTAAAYLLAKAGLSVVCIERGDEPGTKNVMGGVLYRQPMEKIIPGWWRQAPVERPVVEERVWMITEDSMLQAG